MNKLSRKFKGSRFGMRDMLAYAWNKGGPTLLRGMVASLTMRCRLPFFVGRGVRLLHRRHAKIGRNVYIGDYSVLNFLCADGVVIGDGVTIREYGWMQLTSSLDNPGTGIVIGDNTYIGPRANLGAAAPLRIGRKCQIGAGVSFVAENHGFGAGVSIFDQDVTRKGIVIEDDCWIGNGAMILDGVHLGRGCVVGAGSVVTRSFESESIIVGNPGRLLRRRGE